MWREHYSVGLVKVTPQHGINKYLTRREHILFNSGPGENVVTKKVGAHRMTWGVSGAA